MDIARVFLADDHPLIRSGIRAVLGAAADLILVGEAADGYEVRQRCQELAPDVVVLDLHMPGPPPFALVADLRADHPMVNVLILTAYDDGAYVSAALAAGVVGYILKEEEPQTIVQAIRTALHGGTWFSRTVVAKLAQLASSEAPEPALPKLTPREADVLRWIVAAKTNREIGAILGLSEKRVEKRVGELFAKLGVTTRVAAAVRAVREGLV